MSLGKNTPLKIGCSQIYEDVSHHQNYIFNNYATFTAEFQPSVETTTIWNCQILKYHFLHNIQSVIWVRQLCYTWIAASGKKWLINQQLLIKSEETGRLGALVFLQNNLWWPRLDATDEMKIQTDSNWVPTEICRL